MKYQIGPQGWPVGQYLLTGVIDTSADDYWSQLVRGRPLPPNAHPLDEEAFRAMRTLYPTVHLGEPWRGRR